MLAPVRMLLRWLSYVGLGVLVLSYAGVLHPLGDSIAVFRPYLLFALLAIFALMVLVKARLRGAVGVAIVVFVGFEMLPPSSVGPKGGQSLTVYQKNLLYLLEDTRPLEKDIRGIDPDIITLQEVHPRNRKILNNLRDRYPYQHVCPFQSGALAVLSKWPSDGEVLPCDQDGLAAMRIDTGRYRLWVASVHLKWPFPYSQASQAKGVGARLAPLGDPLVIAGDFNMVHWSYTVRELARNAGVRLAGAAGPTFSFREYPISIAIDHVFMPQGGRDAKASVRPTLGSDHLGVVSKFELP